MRRRYFNTGNRGPIDINNYLSIEALEDNLNVTISNNTIEYCIDGDGNWKLLISGGSTESVNTGQTLSFRGKPKLISGDYGSGTFAISKSCNLKGNCMSMLFGDYANNNLSLSGKNYAFYRLFYNCTTIKSVSIGFLPATTLANYCYAYMFSGCTNLTQAPELPATTLADYCYYSMFYNCTSLTTAPELPAMTLASNCYNSMFSGCNSLTIAPSLPATTLASYCYRDMFNGCTNLTTAPTLPATTLADYCYYSMFYNCTSLTTAPELPATTLKNYCYDRMFYNCKKLNYIKAMFTTTPSSFYTYNWVYGVARTGKFIKNKNATWGVTGVNGIPSGWSIQSAAQ